jgi:hypothetical protein
LAPELRFVEKGHARERRRIGKIAGMDPALLEMRHPFRRCRQALAERDELLSLNCQDVAAIEGLDLGVQHRSIRPHARLLPAVF